MEDHDKKIQELEKEIEKLKSDKARVEAMPKNERLANVLHSKQCNWNHTDGCGWDYESWEKPGHARNQYLEKANAMLREMSFEQAMNVIKFL